MPGSQDLSLRWWRSNLLPFYIYWVALNCGTISGPRKDHEVPQGLIRKGNKNQWHIISLSPATAACDYILWFLLAKVCSAYSQTLQQWLGLHCCLHCCWKLSSVLGSGSRLATIFPETGTNYTKSQMETAAWPLGATLGLLLRKFVLVAETRSHPGISEAAANCCEAFPV